MENQTKRSSGIGSTRALQIYVYVTAILVLIILYSSFQRTDSGTLSDEIYLRQNTVEMSGN
jgi:hypothetical protein